MRSFGGLHSRRNHGGWIQMSKHALHVEHVGEEPGDRDEQDHASQRIAPNIRQESAPCVLLESHLDGSPALPLLEEWDAGMRHGRAFAGFWLPDLSVRRGRHDQLTARRA